MVVSSGVNPRRIQRIVFRHDLELSETHRAIVAHLKDVAEKAVADELARLDTLSKVEVEEVCRDADPLYGRRKQQAGKAGDERDYGYSFDER